MPFDALGPLARAASSLSASLSARQLRIVGYHGVADPDRFDTQLQALARRYRFVDGPDVLAAISEGRPLPPKALWLTFDDGHRSVTVDGLPVLQRHGAPATLFVCPGLIAAGSPFWWRVIETRYGPAEVRRLKCVPDDERRAAVDSALGDLPAEVVRNLAGEVADRSEIDRWADSGRSIGNHTWDHPILDRCSAAEQQRQIAEAHRWLTAAGLMAQPLFAYPNGDWTADAEPVLGGLGYGVTLLFDHRLARLDGSPNLSRLRLDTAADLPRAELIASGIHPWLFQFRSRLRSTPPAGGAP